MLDARGELRPTPAEREQMIIMEREVTQHLADLSNHATPRARVVSVEEEAGAGSGDRLPKTLSDAYMLLVHAAYGSDPAIRMGDPAVINGLGRARPRTSTNQPEGVGGSARKIKSKPGQAARSVIKDRESYELKLRIDRRLRKLAHEIEDHLAGEQGSGRTIRLCSHCNRIGEEEWTWCPHYGHEMTTSRGD
jgi:hypothetical protein